MRPTCPAVSHVLTEKGLPSVRVSIAALRVSGVGGARVTEGVLVEGTEDSRVPRPVPVPGWDGAKVASALARAFPSCEVFETGYYTYFLCPRRSA